VYVCPHKTKMMLNCKIYPIKLLIKRQVNLNFQKESPWPFTKKSRIGRRDQKKKKLMKMMTKLAKRKKSSLNIEFLQ